jgi:hypothetical protein
MIAEYESEGLGLPGLPLVVVEYPMGGVPREEAVDRAQRAYDQVLTGLLRDGAGTGEASDGQR